MSQPDLVRIAIALVALRHKPKDRPIASYLLDLQSHFPLANKEDVSRDWRTYALELEKQLAAVKAQRDVDQELISRLHADVSTSDGPPKKKSKKNPVKDQFDPQWTWDQCRADWSHSVSSQFPWSPSLVAAYAALKGALASPNTDLLSYASRLTDATFRALDTIHLFLFSPPTPTLEFHIRTVLRTPSELKPEHINSTRMALASPLLVYVLRTALPTLVRTVHDSTRSKRPRLRPPVATSASDPHAHVDKVLDSLLESVLLPLLRAITPLCFARLAPLIADPVPPKKDKNKGKGKSKSKDKDKDKDKERDTSTHLTPPADARTDVFALIGTSLKALDALPPTGTTEPGGIASGIRDRLGLETIRELETLYAAVPPPVGLAPPAGSSEEEAAATTLPTPTPTPTSTSTSTSVSLDAPQARTEPLAKRLERLTGTRTDRVRALATKDAGWFLASTLNLCVTSTLSTHGSVTGHRGAALGLLRDAILDRIGRLVRSLPIARGCLDSESDGPGQLNKDDNALGDRPGNLSDDSMSKFRIDPVCENLLLAICERALSQLAPP